MKGLAVLTGAAALVLAGCADKAEDIRTASFYPVPASIPPRAYQHLSCKQIAQEASRVSRRVGEVSGERNNSTTDDVVAEGVATIIFWPAEFDIKVDKQTAAKLSLLMGEGEALEQISIQKNCGIVFQRTAPKPEAETDDT